MTKTIGSLLLDRLHRLGLNHIFILGSGLERIWISLLEFEYGSTFTIRVSSCGVLCDQSWQRQAEDCAGR